MPKKRAIEQDEDANQVQLGLEFQNIQCLMISEVKFILEKQLEGKKKSETNEIPIIMQQTLDYCSKFSKFTNLQLFNEIRALFPVADLDYHEFEMSQLANLSCTTVDEAKLLIPSLDRIDDDELLAKLNELTNLRLYQN